jgi:hypothetical protein
MKTFTHSQDHYVCFSSVGFVRMISELIDDNGKKYFFLGQPDPDAVNELSGDLGSQGITYSNHLAKAHNIFEAKACVIEQLIHEEDQPFISMARPFDSYGLMRELGLKNLPLLIGFFTDKETKRIFEEVLKNG